MRSPDRISLRALVSFRANHHRVYPKKASFEKVFIHLKINKIQNVPLAVDISSFGYKFFENDTFISSDILVNPHLFCIRVRRGGAKLL